MSNNCLLAFAHCRRSFMGYYTVYCSPIEQAYKATIISRASLFQLISTLVLIIAPIPIAYQSGEFWKKVEIYREKPIVVFRYESLAILHMQNGSYVAWSTSAQYNNALQTSLRIPLVQATTIDQDFDTLDDEIVIECTFPLLFGEQVAVVEAAFGFNVFLSEHARVAFEGLVYIRDTSQLPSDKLTTIGQLEVRQGSAVEQRGTDWQLSGSLLADVLERGRPLEEALALYEARNLTLQPRDLKALWRPTSAADSFTIALRFFVHQQTFVYAPSILQQLKFAWIQYLAVFAIAYFVIRRVRVFVFRHQLVPSVCVAPLRDKVH